MKKIIKLSDSTIESLIGLKDLYANQYPDEELTYDFIIKQLISENEEANDPEIQRKREEKILEGTVERGFYNTIIADRDKWKGKYEVLESENKDKNVEIKNREESHQCDLEKQQDEYKKLQVELDNKEKKITLLNTRIGELHQNLDGIKSDVEGWLPYEKSMFGIKSLFDKYFKTS